jgi:hypothetical protein
MKENGQATSAAPPRPSTAPSTPANIAAGKRKRAADEEGEVDVEEDEEGTTLNENQAASPDSEERKGSKRIKVGGEISPPLLASDVSTFSSFFGFNST